jgi:hypothetical protein
MDPPRTTQRETRISGERPRPAADADLPPVEGVASFLDLLVALSLEDWLMIGRCINTRPAERTAQQVASIILDATIADRGLQVEAWQVRDALVTTAFLVSQATTRMTGADRRLFSAACDAAQKAALSVLAHDHIAPLDFETLTAPFAAHARFL